MSNVHAGGGGSNGFIHFMQHLGPAIEGWLKDMHAHSYEFTPANAELLNASVKEELTVHDPAAVEVQLDHLLIKILKYKEAAPDIV